MSSRRAPRGIYQHLAEGYRAQRTAGAGRVVNAAPVAEHMNAVAEALGALAVVSSRVSKIDQFTLASSGAQDLTLTYLPVEQSWNCDLNGVTAFWGTDYTVDGQTLSLETALGAVTGDKVQIQYDYLSGQPAATTDALNDLNIPYGSPGWKYNNDLGDATWYSTSFNDSTWSLGTGVLYHAGATMAYTTPFTDGSTGLAGSEEGLGTNVGTAVPEGGLGIEGNFWIRRWFPPGDDITVKIDANNYVEFYVDGLTVGSRSTSARAVSGYGPFDKASSWLLAVHVYCGAGQTWAALDIEVEGTVL